MSQACSQWGLGIRAPRKVWSPTKDGKMGHNGWTTVWQWRVKRGSRATVTLNNASDYRANWLGLWLVVHLSVSPLVRRIVRWPGGRASRTLNKYYHQMHFSSWKCTKTVFVRGSAQNPAVEAHVLPQTYYLAGEGCIPLPLIVKGSWLLGTSVNSCLHHCNEPPLDNFLATGLVRVNHTTYCNMDASDSDDLIALL